MRPLSGKITRKMLLIYGIIYLITLLSIFILVSPRLDREADRRAESALSLMSGELFNVYEQVSGNALSLLYNEDISRSLRQFDSSPDAASEALVNQALSSFVVANASILTASLEDAEHHFFHAVYFSNVCNASSARADERYQELLQAGVGAYYRYLSPEEFAVEIDVDMQYHVMQLTQVVLINRKPYVLRLYGRLNTVISHFSNLADQVFSDLAILYEDGECAFLSGDMFAAEADTLGDLFEYRRTSDRLRQPRGVYFYQRDVNTRWILLGFAPLRYYESTLRNILMIVTLVYLLSAVVYTLFLIRSIRSSLAPLEQLNAAMQSYSAGQPVQTDIHTEDEIEKLNDYFLEMTDKIRWQIEDIRDKEHVNAVVNYKLLATQIDPHFIYNTMNIINIMAREGNTDAIIEINTALIKILRERLNTKISITDTIRNEIDTLYQYSRIMNYRYNNRVLLTMDVAPELLDCFIPKNILQPLAENSYYHGFPALDKGQEGHVDVLIYTMGDELVLEVSDDGIGMTSERLDMLLNQSYEIYKDKKPHIGLDNIRQRLAYIYPDRYQFEIQSSPGYGTTISITIPLGATE